MLFVHLNRVWLVIGFSLLATASFAQASEQASYKDLVEAALKKSSLEGTQVTPVIPVKNKLEFIRQLTSVESPKESFQVVDLCTLPDRLRLWKNYLPRVTPFYAVKTNHDPKLVAVMAGLGTSFDCASEKEMEQVIGLGVNPERIIFAHPRKTITGIKRAIQLGVKKMVFDSAEELDKMLKYAPEAEYVLRIKTDDSHSVNQFSIKFGATIDESYGLLDQAFQKNAKVIGISFHVGSNCDHVQSYEKAIMDTARLFNYAKTKWNKKLLLVDLGGGWPGSDDDKFIRFSKRITQFLDESFSPEVQIIAEPGRYFSTQSTTIVTRIIGKSSGFDQKKKQKTFSYYLTNGVYGSFLSSVYYNYDQEKTLSEGWKFHPLTAPKKPDSRFPSLLWGPTCDSGDKIFDALPLPELESGSYIYVEDAGAYTTALETDFNQISISSPVYVCE